MRINHNISALNTYRQLFNNNSVTQKSIEKLSSGLRVNRAGDDAAGLAISEKMRAQIRGLSMASKNSQDSISLIQTAEGALNETHSILQRMRELAVQAASDTNVTSDRQEIQKEITQLTSEINRIANTTEFNTMKLLNGDKADTVKAIKADVRGYDPTGLGMTVDLNALALSTEGITLAAASDADWSNVTTGSITITKNTAGELSVKIDALFTGGAPEISSVQIDDKVTVSFTNGEFTYNDHGVSFTFTQKQWEDAVAGKNITLELAAAFNHQGTTAFDATTSFAVNNSIRVSGLTNSKITGVNILGNIEFEIARMSAVLDIENGVVRVNLLDKDGNNIVSDTINYSAGALTGSVKYNNHGISFEVQVWDTSAVLDTSTIALDFDISYQDKAVNNGMTFQVGANENQTMGLSISEMNTKALGLSTDIDEEEGFAITMAVTNGTDNVGAEYALDVTSQENAAAAITAIDNALQTVSAERSKLGAVQNRLEHTIANLDTSAENLTASESRIRDVDMAKEMMEFTKNSILQQAAQAMLAQANQQPQGVLQLLR
ncbi:MAG: hypothetical protein JL50_16630 [Peptococcaceae bacterium BICA1-7]|nr:MAG: hypothetical protein JL50_16630 [Peptococcaceae bacterium BICA1-7]HBV96581.1 flagellin [Desulfotomaculum sp.]